MRSRGMNAWLVAATLAVAFATASAHAGEDDARKRGLRTIDRIIVTEPLPPVADEPRLDFAAAPGVLAWTHTTITTDAGARGVLAVGEPSQGLLVWLMLTALIAAGGWLGWSQQGAVVTRLKARFAGVSWADRVVDSVTAAFAAAAARLRRTVAPAGAGAGAGYTTEVIDARLARVTDVVAAMGRALPLREVLEDELGRVRQRLATARASGDGAARGRLAAPAFRVLMRDLERIERIASSARRSIAGETTDPAVTMPASARQAYEVLGINANVTDATLKKILDALRMSWHPDLAGDDDDRRLREERIKQINIAGELIAAERRSSPRASVADAAVAP